jgi:hypothetical protein
MPRLIVQFVALMLAPAFALVTAGCGTTRSTDTNRTATEQLLISNAIDKAVQSVDLKTLAGQTVYLDDSRLGEVVDRNYLISTLRQHILASGCNLKDQKDQADFIVEARAGAVGTDRNDLLFGVPSTNVPQIMPMQPVPAAVIPEIPLAKRRDQRGIAKLAVFAYHRETGTPVWQSGLVHQESSSNDVWILGAGPFQRGSIYDGTSFAGKEIGHDDEEADETKTPPRRLPAVDLAESSVFTPPKQFMKDETAPPATAPVGAPAAAQSVVQASHEASPPPAAPANPPPVPAAAPAVATASPAEPPAGTGPTQPSIPPTPAEPRSVYAPAGTSQLPQPRFESR